MRKLITLAATLAFVTGCTPLLRPDEPTYCGTPDCREEPTYCGAITCSADRARPSNVI